METVGIRALKQNASAVVARAAAGETVVITDRGRPVARLVPLQESRLARMRAEGRTTPAVGRLADLPEPTEVGDLTGVLLAMRDEDER
jgi:prevent-host-death family protein